MFVLTWICALGGTAALDAVATAGIGTEVSQWLQDRRTELPFSLDPGISVAVVSGHGLHIDLVAGYGLQHLQGNVRVSHDTLFEIGSISKTLIALAFGVLVDRGSVHFDDKLAELLGSERFQFGPEMYVGRHLTLRDLLSHRSGLGEGQGDFFTAVHPSQQLPAKLGAVSPAHELRETFDYSNAGWNLAGEVLRIIAGTDTWCEALHTLLLEPLRMNQTFCDRNTVVEHAEVLVAGVHRMNPCDGLSKPTKAFRHHNVSSPLLRAYNLSRTGPAGTFAWGAADASGSVMSSISDMTKILCLLLSAHVPVPSKRLAAAGVVHQDTLAEMLSGQMVVPIEFQQALAFPGSALKKQEGSTMADGLGFDLVGRLPSIGVPSVLAGAAHAEKNGDTAMHKARLSLLPQEGIAVLLLSNLGGETGDQLTALKFGVLALAAGASRYEADALIEEVLVSSDFWNQRFRADRTCTSCRTVLSAYGPCFPSNLTLPPVPPARLAGTFSDSFLGSVLRLQVDPDSSMLMLQLGPIRSSLLFGPQNMALWLPCSRIRHALQLPAWLMQPFETEERKCLAIEFRVPPEVPMAGISNLNGTVGFPWGCGTFPLPDGMPVVAIVEEQRRGTVVDEKFWILLPTALVLMPRTTATLNNVVV